MRELSDVDFITYSIHTARKALIQARIARQKATIEQECDMVFGDESDIAGSTEELFAEAKALRLKAQELLRKVEKLNGQRFSAGETTFPLKDYLVGRFFKCWKEFDYEYAKIGAPLFGIDPE